MVTGKMRREQILELVRQYKLDHGVPPTQRWIAEQLGISAVTVHEHLTSMIYLGLIDWDKHSNHCLKTSKDEIVYTPRQRLMMEAIRRQQAAGGNLKLKDLAAELGVSGPTAFQMLKRMETRGALRYEKNVIQVLDCEFREASHA